MADPPLPIVPPCSKPGSSSDIFAVDRKDGMTVNGHLSESNTNLILYQALQKPVGDLMRNRRLNRGANPSTM